MKKSALQADCRHFFAFQAQYVVQKEAASSISMLVRRLSFLKLFLNLVYFLKIFRFFVPFFTVFPVPSVLLLLFSVPTLLFPTPLTLLPALMSLPAPMLPQAFFPCPARLQPTVAFSCGHALPHPQQQPAQTSKVQAPAIPELLYRE